MNVTVVSEIHERCGFIMMDLGAACRSRIKSSGQGFFYHGQWQACAVSVNMLQNASDVRSDQQMTLQ